MPTCLNESVASSQPTKAETEPSYDQNSKPKPGITFASQDNLPKLPIPALDSTCKKYLESLKPLQTYREQRETEAAVQEFLKSDGLILQERLKKYATGKSSYIEQFCMCSTTRRCFDL